jgi:hypothetical protein
MIPLNLVASGEPLSSPLGVEEVEDALDIVPRSCYIQIQLNMGVIYE